MGRQQRDLWRRRISGRSAAAMLRDIFEARHDLAGLAEAYGLDPAELASWANDEHNRTVLQGLCVLADLQTQLMLSRYRQLAVAELIRQANGGEDEEGQATVSPEQARRACVELLRADLKPISATGRASQGGDAEADDPATDLRKLRAAIYGGASALEDADHNTRDEHHSVSGDHDAG